ncbi:LytR/AlgR family response regulator transcription factor [Xanthocytophaga flava]|uniref:LytR/AlgR family response regulator transcription factor n=1 Tax=Xanthocytophaga flava TaxID=3048013 RepID=UPI0028D2B155|nr:LytTR family DNA-binding domain-containing protein [Xanthocytophaga flavus]MDJ1472242.1 LytTR family DNA-binding domain-containing protein [Xanthocytophaga flavus]
MIPASVSQVAYKDKWVRAIILPLMLSFQLYLDYSEDFWDWKLVYCIVADILTAILVWELVRMVVLLLDRYYHWQNGFLKRLLLQLLITVPVCLVLIIGITWTTYTFIVTSHDPNLWIYFYRIDLPVIAILLCMLNFIYVSLYFYRFHQQQSFAMPLAEKPIEEERNVPLPTPENSRLLIKSGKKELILNISEVIGAFVTDGICWVVTTEGKKLVVDCSLDYLEVALKTGNFFRANRQLILSRILVKSIHSDTYGKIKVVLKEGSGVSGEIFVSRTKAAEFRKWIKTEIAFHG